jgi:RNA ligase (TIGR02306 family)
MGEPGRGAVSSVREVPEGGEFLVSRTLASIQKIESLTPIDGADNIEVARCLGWNVVVRKGEFNVGDPIVYFEIDSLLPSSNPYFDFLASRGTKKVDVGGKIHEGYRLRTIRLRGQISQGLVAPLSLLPETAWEQDGGKSPWNIGDDVTDLLGIVKYEPDLSKMGDGISGKVKGLFPSFIPKTDETRIQSMPALLDRLKHAGPIYVTEKLDGTSCTVFFRDGEVNVCSRNLNMLPDEENKQIHWKAVKACGLDEKATLRGDWAFQGEVMGGKVQGNKLGLATNFYLYSIYSIRSGKYLSAESLRWVADRFQIPMVPILMWNESDFPSTVDEWVDYATRKSVLNPQQWAEGVVVRPMQETYEHLLGNHLSFKVLNNSWLLEEK